MERGRVLFFSRSWAGAVQPKKVGARLSIREAAAGRTTTVAARTRCFSDAPATGATSAGQWKHLHLQESHEGAVVEVRMNRPELHNAFNEELIEELRVAFNPAPEESPLLRPGRRVVLLSAAGSSAFSAGADLNWMRKMAQYSREQNRQDALRLYDMFYRVAHCPLPVIARVNGVAYGGGVGLVACCDMAIATEQAQFGLTEVRLGIVPAVISPFVLRKIGPSACHRYMLTGERFSAAEALRVQLISEIARPPANLVTASAPAVGGAGGAAAATAAAEALDRAVEQLVQSLLQASPSAVAQCKRELLWKVPSLTHQSEEALRSHVAEQIAVARSSPEGQQGLQAFLQKQPVPWLKPVAK